MNEFPTKPKENAPHEVGYYLNLGGPGRNRTTDTRIFNFVPQTKLSHDHKRLPPTIDKLYSQNCLGCLYGIDLVDIFDRHKECSNNMSVMRAH